jgi:hypothetical protein
MAKAEVFDVDYSVLLERTAVWAGLMKKELGELSRTQFKGIVREVIRTTPPGSAKTQGAAAKKSGENKIRGDVMRAIIPTRSNRVDTNDVAGVIASLRNSRGTVRRPSKKVRVPSQAATAYIKEKQRMVGYVAGAWNPAAAKLGYKPPAWIWRHGSPGSIKIEISDDRILFRATNRVSYAGNLRFFKNRIQGAVDDQASKLFRQISHVTGNTAKKAGIGK